MHYAIYATDAPNSFEKRRSTRPAHLQRLNELQQQGRLILAGPLLNEDHENPAQGGFCGSLIIAEFDSIEDAKAWAAADPYVTANVYANIEIKPFVKALP